MGGKRSAGKECIAMLKFKCSHCDGRLALHPRHLGRLARCPECGGVTHPMAQQILAGQKPIEKTDCDNCGHALGKLLKPRNWQGATVCTSCFHALCEEEREREELTLADENRAAKVTVRTLPTSSAQPRMTAEERAPRRLPAPASDSARDLQWPELRAMARSAATGLLLCAAALIVLTYIIRAMGTLLLWSAAVLLLALAGILIWRSYVALRRRFAGTSTPQGVPVRAFLAPIKGLLRSTYSA